ncbi:MAG: SH3 domain-containing protein [Pseudomonadota bacterium]
MPISAFDAGLHAQEGEAQPSEVLLKERPGRTGLPLPRFVSFRASEVNLRTGPGSRYPIDWVYKRRGLPVEIIDEFETWRHIKDWQGSLGWVHQSMLQGKRTLMITGNQQLLRLSPTEDSPGLAMLEPGVIGKLLECTEGWCRIKIRGHKGWLQNGEFFGAYASEKLE